MIDGSRHGVAHLRCEVVRLYIIRLGDRVLRCVLGEILVPFDVRPFELMDVLHFGGYLAHDIGIRLGPETKWDV